MIPLDTPPGTEVVFVGFGDWAGPKPPNCPEPIMGDVCIVLLTSPDECFMSGGSVKVDLYPGWFCLSCFRLLHKPRELYDLLATTPVDLSRATEPCA